MNFQFDVVFLCSSSLLLSILHHPAVTNHIALGTRLNRMGPVGLVHVLGPQTPFPFQKPA